MLKARQPARRRIAETLGRLAERDVAAVWQSRGYSVLAQRLRNEAGELDLVVANSEELIFLEVKARKTAAEAAYAVSRRQQMRLLDVASLALAMNAGWARPNMRFDVALVCGGTIQHIQDAIRAE